ncbi:MAG: efflux RND transporter permease subunit [Nitrospiraceae bacterium]
MNLIEFSIRKPVTVTVGVLLIVLFGAASLTRLPVQLTPDVEKPEITVTTTWRGASPQEVEREIIDEQEEQLKGVEGLEKMTSQSAYGRGTITLRFPAGSDIDTALLQVSNRLNQVKEYPFEADEPVIQSANTGGSAMAWFIFEPTEGNTINIETMRDFVEDVVKPKFERVQGVAASNVYGGREREIRVLVDPAKVAARSITLMQLAQALDQENRNFSAGDFEEGKRSYVVRTVGEYRSPDDVGNVVVTVRNGAPVYVADIATVSFDYKDPEHVVREMGQTAIAVNAIREVGANVLDTMAGLRATMADLNEGVLHPLGFTLYQVYDEADYVNSSLTLVQQNLIIGSLLAVTVLFLFLRTTSSTLVIGLAIPISIMGTFIMLWLLGRNLNVVSLAGMTFAAGMLVDNSIVVLENIYRHRQEGKPLFRAAYDGTVEVWGAILASTLTTIAVFVPIIFIEEQAGQLFRDIAIAISAGVGLSLVTSITVIPSLSARVLRTVAPGAKEESDRLRGEPVVRSALGRLAEMSRSRGWSSQRVGAFIYWLCGSTGWRLAVVIGFTSLAIGLSWAMVPQAEYLPQGNRNLIIAIVLPPPGYSLQELTSLGSSIESVLRPHWEAEPGSVEEAALDGPSIKNFFYVARGRQVFMGGRVNDGSRVKELLSLFRRATADLPGVISIITQRGLFERGLAEGRSIDIEISGPELETLIALGGRIFGQVRALISGAQVRPMPSLDLGSPELQVAIKRDRSADVQMTNRDLAFTIDVLVDGAKASDFQLAGDEIDLTLRGDDRYATRTQDLEMMPIFTPSGRVTTEGAIADVKLDDGH